MKLLIIGLSITATFAFGALCTVNVQPYRPTVAEQRATAYAAGEFPDEIISEVLYVTPYITPTVTTMPTADGSREDEESAPNSTDSSDSDDPNDPDDPNNPNPPPVVNVPPTAAPQPTLIALQPSPTAPPLPPTNTPAPSPPPSPTSPPALIATPTSPPPATSLPPTNVPVAPPPPNDDNDDDDDDDGNDDDNPPVVNTPVPPTDTPPTSIPPTDTPPTTVPGLPDVGFGEVTYQSNEGDGSRLITVLRAGNLEQSFGLRYRTADETATANFDYTPTEGTLTFAVGQAEASFNVPIIDDATDDPARETVSLQLSDSTVSVNLTRPTAQLEIFDDDSPPTIQFSQTTFSVGENQPSLLTVTLSHPSGQFVAVSYDTFAPFTAIANQDFAPFTVGTLGLAPDASGRTPTSFTISWSDLLDDQQPEAAETVNFRLNSPLNATLGNPATASLTIVDND